MADVSVELARFRIETDPSRRRALLNRIVIGQQGLIRKLTAKAMRQEKSGEQFEDLLQVGMIGFCTAVERFKPDKGCKLSTYAAFWIRHEVQEATRRSREIRLPRIPLRKEDRDRVVLALRANPSATAAEIGVEPRALDQTRHSIGLVFLGDDAPRAMRAMDAMSLERHREEENEQAARGSRGEEEEPMEAIERIAAYVAQESHTKAEICAGAGISPSEFDSIYRKQLKKAGKVTTILSGVRVRFCAPTIAEAERKKHRHLKVVPAPRKPAPKIAPPVVRARISVADAIAIAERCATIEDAQRLAALAPDRRAIVLALLAA